MENRDIIIVGQQAWDTEIGSNCKNIALEFAKKNRVLYVNFPLDRITRYRGKNDPKIQKRLGVIEGLETGLVHIEGNLYNLYPDCLIESINWIRNDFIFDFFNKINNRRFAKSVQKAIAELQFSNYVIFNDSDIFRSLYLKELLKPVLSVYYSRDNMIATDYWRRHGLILEPKIIAKSDLCVANSEYLRDYCGTYNPKSYYVGQGCDFTIFENFKREDRVAEGLSFNGPVIGYVGVLTAARLDIDLIDYIATTRPDWHIVLVGPEDDDFKQSLLHQRDNVHFLGAKPTSDLPKYIDSFDICFNPQVLNALTIGNYPRKIDEYLALGKPTVATKTESMDVFKDHVALVNTKEEYIIAITDLLAQNSEAKIRARIEFALSHTWENSVELIYEAIGASLNP